MMEMERVREGGLPWNRKHRPSHSTRLRGQHVLTASGASGAGSCGMAAFWSTGPRTYNSAAGEIKGPYALVLLNCTQHAHYPFAMRGLVFCCLIPGRDGTS